MKKKIMKPELILRVLLAILLIVNMIVLANIAEVNAVENTPLTIGYLNNDENPFTTAMANWGYNAAVAIDYDDTSVGIDQGSIKQVTKVELWDSDDATRCRASNYELYWSNDNITYSYIGGVSFSERSENGKKVNTFEFSGIVARYIKVHSTYNDFTGYTFIIDPFQTSVKAFDMNQYTEITSKTVGYHHNDETPLSTGVDNWGYNSSVAIDYDDTSIGIDVGTAKMIAIVEIVDEDNSTRCTAQDYELFWSINNTAYTSISNFSFSESTVNGKKVHTFQFPAIKARYIKIHSKYSDFLAFTFVMDPLQSKVKAYSIPEPYSVGYLNNDVNPTGTPMENWGYSAPIAIDYDDTSIGIDQGYIKKVTEVELWDSDNQTRCTESSYELYWSNDNITYTSIEDFTFRERTENGVKVHAFRFEGISARYIKIHSTYDDFTSYTFILDPFPISVKAFGFVYSIGYVNNDESPMSTAMSNWGYNLPTAIDYDDTSIGIDLGGIKQVTKVEIMDEDNSTRCTASSYELYWSNYNTSYKQISGVTFSERTENGKKVHTFVFSGITAQYIKIHSTYSDYSNYTFILNPLQTTVSAYDTSADYVLESKTVGFVENDADPLTTIINNWGYNYNVGIDYHNTSVGIDIGSEKQIGRVEIQDSNSASRCSASSYELFWSTDNISYTKIPHFKFNTEIVDGKLINIFEFNGVSARYIKIHSTHSDYSFTFVLAPLQSNVRIYSGIKPDPVIENVSIFSELLDFIRLPNGNVFSMSINNYAYISEDEGNTWQYVANQVPPPHNIQKMTITSDGIIVGIIGDPDTDFFEWDNTNHRVVSHAHTNYYSVRSLDYGVTWSNPVPIYTEGLYFCGAARDIRELSNGTLLLPLMRLVDEFGQARHAIVTYYSLDKGQTWLQSTGIIDIGGWGNHDGAMEPTVEEYLDGSVCMIIRTTLDVFYKVYSYDKGVTWDLNTLQATTIDAAAAPGYLIKLASGRLVLAYNRVDLADGTLGVRWGGDCNFSQVPTSMQRNELSIIFSDDNGTTWSSPQIIDYGYGCYLRMMERNPGEIWIISSGAMIYKIYEDDL